MRLGGAFPLAPKPADLAAVCRLAVDEARALHRKRTIRLDTQGELSGTWDPARLAQMLSNLIENAVRHGAREGPVAVSACEEGTEAVLRVHNEGEPIPEPLLKRLFEPLASTEESAEGAEGSSGLGLGLYIASAIAHAHGGSIRVESTQAQGTTFSVFLPRRK
jgi:signal transduction histidine kinase